MKYASLFGLVVLIGGWGLQTVLFYAAAPGTPLPHLLLLAVLALAGFGFPVLALNVGLVWGLGLDVFGTSLFGCQGLLMVLAAYGSGRFSRQLNVDKFVTQEALAFFGSAIFLLGFWGIEQIFRSGGAVRAPGLGVVVWQLVMNLIFGPVVFWLVRRAIVFWGNLTGSSVRHG